MEALETWGVQTATCVQVTWTVAYLPRNVRPSGCVRWCGVRCFRCWAWRRDV